MAVTENDIIQNAAAIASLINTGAANVNITDLDAVTSLADANLLHVSVSAIDKKITYANLISDFLNKDGSVELTADWDAGSYKITAEQLESDVATGTAPLVIASTTKVSNLNVDQVDGYHLDQDVTNGASPFFDQVSATASTTLLLLAGTGGAGRSNIELTAENIINYDADSHLIRSQNAGTTYATINSSGVATVNALLSGYVQLDDISAPGNPNDGEGRLYKKTGDDGLFWIPDSAGSEVDLTNDTVPDLHIKVEAGSFIMPPTLPAVPNTRTCTNVVLKEHLMSDSAEEYVMFAFNIPKTFTSSGDVTFIAKGMAVTADGNELQLSFHSAPVDKDEDIDSATFDEVDSGDYETSNTQNVLDEVEWTESWADLGWSAGDRIFCKVKRIAIDGGTPVSGDWGLQSFEIYAPRSA